MSVEPLFGHGSARLLVDRVTRRVVYVAHDGVLPERVLFVDDGRQHLFAPTSACCEVVEFSGELPSGMSALTCWTFRATAAGFERVSAAASPRTESSEPAESSPMRKAV